MAGNGICCLIRTIKQKTVGVNLLQRKKKKKLAEENRTDTLVHIYRFY